MYQLLETFLLRTPYYPFSALSDFEKKRHELVFKEMLQIATPDLSEAVEKCTDRAQYSAYRYYQRACTRPTPFGLFAGCSVGIIGERTEIQLLKHEMYKRVTRLDMNYICALTQLIERDAKIREQLRYYLNSSMYPAGNHLRYVEYNYRKTRRVHHITQMENSEYVQKVLTLAREGARFAELAAALVDEEITMEEASDFIHEMIDTQVLISELEPTVTNIRPLTSLVAKLNKWTNANNYITGVLSEIESQLAEIDQRPVGETGDIYPAIVKNIKKTKVEAEVKYLFQADMFKPALHATVSRKVIKEIQQALIFLTKINASSARSNISQFRENFIKRYEHCEMPLLFVLDNELGIGYAGNTSGDITPLVDDLAVPRGNSPSNILQPSIQTILLQRCRQSLQKTIELTDEDVKGIEAVWNDLPPTFSAVCQILQDDDDGCSFLIKSVGGQSAANLMGRFCHLDEQILNHTLAITQKEAQINPNVVFAEIVHLPESRIGNILLRPVLRPYEIPYLAKSGVSREFELSPDGLYVSVKDNRVVLRSKRLNKEVVPRMSTAHNYGGQNSMPVYHFLCDMQRQSGRIGLGVYWSETAQHLDYLPRIVYKNCILQQARWTVREKEIKAFVGTKDDNELLLKVKEWRHGRNIPNTALLSDGDNELYVDMNNPLSIRSWLSVVKKRSFFHLEEFLFNPETAVVKGPEGVFTNEFIFAFFKELEK